MKVEHIRAARMVDACINALALAVQHAQYDLGCGPLEVVVKLGPSTDFSNVRKVTVTLDGYENDGPCWTCESALIEALEVMDREAQDEEIRRKAEDFDAEREEASA